MTTEHRQFDGPPFPAYVYAPQPPRAPENGSVKLVFAILAGCLVFSGVCLYAGLMVIEYAKRMDLFDRSADRAALAALAASDSEFFRERERAFASRESRDSRGRGDSRDAAPAAPAPVAANQPNIYFMVGGQGGGAPYPVPAAPAVYQMPVAQPPYGLTMPVYYPPAQPAPYQIQTDINNLLLQKYQSEFAEFLRQRAMPQQGREVATQAVPDAWTDEPSGYSAMRTPRMEESAGLATTDIVVPAALTMSLKGRFSRDREVETWFAEETRANQEAAADGGPVVGGGGQNGQGEPNLDDILRDLAETTFADQQYERTARIYAELASRSVALSVTELLRWAKSAELSNDPESAMKILDLILKSDPENPAVLKEAAILAVGHQKFSVAADYYLRLMKAQPEIRDWRVWRAKTLTWSGRGKEAVDLMGQLYREDPGDWELNLMLAELLLAEHRFEESLPILDTLIAHDPADDTLKERKMNALMALQRFKDAAGICAELLVKYPGNADLLLKMAVNLVAGQEFAAAVDPFEKYLALKPDDVKVREQFAECLMAAQQFNRAAEQFGMLVEAVPESRVAFLGKQANAYMAANNFSQAADVYRQLLPEKPGDAEVATNLVICLRMSDQKHEALAVASNYLATNPGDTKMLVQAAEIAGELKNYSQSIKWYRMALRMNPGDPAAHMGLANALLWDAQFENAESEFRKVLVFEPGHPIARRGLARSLYFQRKFEESFKTYRELARDDPDAAIAAEYRYYRAMSVGMEDEASRQLLILQDAEPEEITWRGDRVQSLLRQHRFKEAKAQAGSVYELDPYHQATLKGIRNANFYLTTWPVDFHAGYLRKVGDRSENEEQDRKANLAYNWYGFHGEKSAGYNLRFTGDIDREHWNMREDFVSNADSDRVKLGAMWMGHPTISGKAEIGYRWFNNTKPWWNARGEEKRIDDQWLYDARLDMREVGGTSLKLGVFSRRREHYDNFVNVYDNLYAYDFGVDGLYRWNKWDFIGFAQGSVLTDSNSNYDLGASVKYRLIQTPKLLLMLGGNVEYLDWQETKPDYFSPQNFYKYGLDLDMRYYICRDPEVWGGCETYIDFMLSVYRDRFGSTGQKVGLGYYQDVNRRLSLFARADFTRESYYTEVKLFGGIEYKFGGCK